MKIAVIYQSHYGTTRQYAAWIAEELDAALIEKSTVTPEELLRYDIVLYGGGLYAGGILGIELVTKNPCNRLIVFTVGLAAPDSTDYSQILDKNLPADLQRKTKVFHLRGGIDYKKLGFVHRCMMALMKRFSIDRKPPAALSDEDRQFLETYGGKVDFTDRRTIEPIVDCVIRILYHSACLDAESGHRLTTQTTASARASIPLPSLTDVLSVIVCYVRRQPDSAQCLV